MSLHFSSLPHPGQSSDSALVLLNLFLHFFSTFFFSIPNSLFLNFFKAISLSSLPFPLLLPFLLSSLVVIPLHTIVHVTWDNSVTVPDPSQVTFIELILISRYDLLYRILQSLCRMELLEGSPLVGVPTYFGG